MAKSIIFENDWRKKGSKRNGDDRLHLRDRCRGAEGEPDGRGGAREDTEGRSGFRVKNGLTA